MGPRGLGRLRRCSWRRAPAARLPLRLRCAPQLLLGRAAGAEGLGACLLRRRGWSRPRKRTTRHGQCAARRRELRRSCRPRPRRRGHAPAAPATTRPQSREPTGASPEWRRQQLMKTTLLAVLEQRRRMMARLRRVGRRLRETRCAAQAATAPSWACARPWEADACAPQPAPSAWRPRTPGRRGTTTCDETRRRYRNMSLSLSRSKPVLCLARHAGVRCARRCVLLARRSAACERSAARGLFVQQAAHSGGAGGGGVGRSVLSGWRAAGETGRHLPASQRPSAPRQP